MVNAPADEAATDQLADFRTAAAAVLATVGAIADGRLRFRVATDLSALVADLAVRAAEMKSAAALQVAEDEELSLTHLADRLSVSKAHAGRLHKRGVEIREAGGRDTSHGQ